MFFTFYRDIHMSAIDCIDHICLGYLYNLPVYWAIGTHDVSTVLDVEVHSDEPIPARNIIYVGGGGGEHPALPIEINNLLHWFFLNIFDRVDEDDLEEDSLDPESLPVDENTNRFINLLLELRTQVGNQKIDECRGADGMNLRTIIDLNWWDLETYIRLAEKYKSDASPNEELPNLRTCILLTLYHIVTQTIPMDELYRLSIISPTIAELVKTFERGVLTDALPCVPYNLQYVMTHGAKGVLGRNTGRMTDKEGKIIPNYSMHMYLANPELHQEQTWLNNTAKYTDYANDQNGSVTYIGLAC